MVAGLTNTASIKGDSLYKALFPEPANSVELKESLTVKKIKVFELFDKDGQIFGYLIKDDRYKDSYRVTLHDRKGLKLGSVETSNASDKGHRIHNDASVYVPFFVEPVCRMNNTVGHISASVKVDETISEFKITTAEGNVIAGKAGKQKVAYVSTVKDRIIGIGDK